MGDAVHKEGNVEGYTEAAVEQNPEGLPQGLIPVVPWHKHRDDYDKDGKQWHVQPGKHEIKHTIICKGRIINLLSFWNTSRLYWDVKTCSVEDNDQCFGGNCGLRFHFFVHLPYRWRQKFSPKH